MTGLTSIVTYLNFSEEKKKDYIMERYNLSEAYLVGRINISSINTEGVYISHLRNPFKYELISKTPILIDENNNEIFIRDVEVVSYLEEKVNASSFVENDLVIFPIKIVTDKNKIKNEMFLRTEIEYVKRFRNIIDINFFEQYPILKNYILTEMKVTKSDGSEEYVEDVQEKLTFLNKASNHILLEKAIALDEKETALRTKKKELESHYKKYHQKLTEAISELKEFGFEIKYPDFPKEIANKGDSNKTETLDLSIVKSNIKNLKVSPPQIVPKNIVSALRNQLFLHDRLIFDEELIRQIFHALKMNKFIILAGDSGTGKSTIIESLSKIMNAEYYNIPVQPSWIDQQDLLGFYNPISSLYQPTEFLTALLEANKHPENLYFVNLDEINLSKVENYMADFLSERERKNRQQMLSLYSKLEYEKNKIEIATFYKELNDNGDTYQVSLKDKIEILTRQRNMNQFPAQIPIPENIRFFGTMNTEGYVQSLSPKVVDRAFIINVKIRERRTRFNDDQLRTEEKQIYDFKPENLNLKKDNLSNMRRLDLENLEKVLSHFGVFPSARLKQHIRLYVSSFDKLENEISSENTIENKKLVNDIILMKYLPRIHYPIEQDFNGKELLDLVAELTISEPEETPTSLDKLQDMVDKAEANGIFSYWS